MFKHIKELAKTERGKLKLKLGGYMAFFILVVLLVLIFGSGNSQNQLNTITESKSSKDVDKDEVDTKVSYSEKQAKLWASDYKYNFKIMGDTITIFSGEYKNGESIGFKETEDNVVKYRIKSDRTVYIMQLESEQIYENLYENLEKELFDFENLFSKLKSASAIIDKRDKEISYTYHNISGYDILVKTTEKYIQSINIKNDTLEYNFTFDYIN